MTTAGYDPSCLKRNTCAAAASNRKGQGRQSEARCRRYGDWERGGRAVYKCGPRRVGRSGRRHGWEERPPPSAVRIPLRPGPGNARAGELAKEAHAAAKGVATATASPLAGAGTHMLPFPLRGNNNKGVRAGPPPPCDPTWPRRESLCGLSTLPPTRRPGTGHASLDRCHSDHDRPVNTSIAAVMVTMVITIFMTILANAVAKTTSNARA